MSIIKVENVSYDYRRFEEEKLPAVRGVSFEIEEGEFVVIGGANGSGKSTLAKMLNGLLKPTCGKIEVLGMDVSNEEKVFEIRRNVGIVFQNPDNQTVASIVEDDVAFGPEIWGCRGKKSSAACSGRLKRSEWKSTQSPLRLK